MKQFFYSFLLLIICHGTMAQKHTISGFVEDPNTGERLIGVNVYDEKTLIGTMTNVYGFYSITLPEDSIHLVFSYVGYQPNKQIFFLNEDKTIHFTFEKSEEIEAVEIYADKNTVESSQMSMNRVNPATIDKIPVLLGEKDLIKTLQLLPGVQSGSEGSSALYVRGGGADQNLILLDGVPVYNANHLFGFFSVFNTDAIQNVSLIKGGFPARYGGRLSSVLDIRLKEGNNKEFKAQGSIGLISSKLTLEGPIQKNKSSFLISGRRTYIDVLMQPMISMVNQTDESTKLKGGYFFHDLNVKLNYLFSDKDRLFLSVYTGKDKAYFDMEYDEDAGSGNESYDSGSELWWGNITGALRWNHVYGNKLFSNTTVTYSRYKFLIGQTYNYSIDTTSEEFIYDYFSGINDISAKIDFDYHPASSHEIKFGGNYTHHTFHPGINVFSLQTNTEGIDTTFGNVDIDADEFYVYAEDDISITPRIKANIGAHYSGFFVRNNFYQSIQPRISARFKINNNIAIKAAFTQMTQYIHLLTNQTIGLPTDLWVPATDKVKPQRSNQYAIGAVYSLNKKGLEISLEGFYKDMKNMIEYKEGASFFSIESDWEEKVETGEGWAYGGEILLEKKSGKLTGWIGYTLAWSNRQFPNISYGQIFPAGYDRRHDISITLNYKFNEKIDAGVVWVYGSGYPITLALEKYPYAADPRQLYQSFYYSEYIENIEHRNNYRMPAYHRLDAGVNFHKQKKRFSRTWSVGLYNAYNRINPFYLDFGYEDNDFSEDSDKVLKMYGLFPLIPSISYSFKF